MQAKLMTVQPLTVFVVFNDDGEVIATIPVQVDPISAVDWKNYVLPVAELTESVLNHVKSQQAETVVEEPSPDNVTPISKRKPAAKAKAPK